MGLISIGWLDMDSVKRWHLRPQSGKVWGQSVFGEGNQYVKGPRENQLQEHCKGCERL